MAVIKANEKKGCIAVSVVSPDGLAAQIDMHFGRAPYFLLVNNETFDLVEIVQNQVADSLHGAGTKAASTLATHGVTDVISGQYGPKAYTALQSLDIRMWMAGNMMSAQEALDAFADNRLKQHELKVY